MVPYANQRGLDGGFSGRHYMAMSRHPLYNQSHPAASNLSKRESKSKSESKSKIIGTMQKGQQHIMTLLKACFIWRQMVSQLLQQLPCFHQSISMYPSFVVRSPDPEGSCQIIFFHLSYQEVVDFQACNRCKMSLQTFISNHITTVADYIK